jgi:hypothetical protein
MTPIYIGAQTHDLSYVETYSLGYAGSIARIGFVRISDLPLLNRLWNASQAGNDVTDQPSTFS